MWANWKRKGKATITESVSPPNPSIVPRAPCLSSVIYPIGRNTGCGRISPPTQWKHLHRFLVPRSYLLVLSCEDRRLGSCPPPYNFSLHSRAMLDSVTHSTFLPNPSFCDPLMSWTDLFSNEEYYPTFEHQTGELDWDKWLGGLR